MNTNTIAAEGLGVFFKNLGKKGSILRNRRLEMFLKTVLEPWISEQTLLTQLLLESLKQLYQHYEKWSIFVTQEKVFISETLF